MSDQCQSVYVVDDDASVRESVEGLIRTAGLRVESFASPQEFLNRCCSKLPSCLVLDMKLPGMSGLEVQGELAKADVHVPIIFLTGHGNIEMSVQAMKSGALDFFTKPLDSEALLVAIRDAIDHYARHSRQRTNRARGAQLGSSDAARTVAALPGYLNHLSRPRISPPGCAAV